MLRQLNHPQLLRKNQQRSAKIGSSMILRMGPGVLASVTTRLSSYRSDFLRSINMMVHRWQYNTGIMWIASNQAPPPPTAHNYSMRKGGGIIAPGGGGAWFEANNIMQGNYIAWDFIMEISFRLY